MEYGERESPASYQAAEDDAVPLNEFVRLCGEDSVVIRWEGKNLAFPAARAGNLEKLRWLVDQGVDPAMQDPNGYTPLVMATLSCGREQRPVISYLIGLGVDLEAKSSWGESPLRTSLRIGSYEVVKDLLDAGANPDACDFTQLHQAAAWGDQETLAARIAEADHLEERDTWERTPWLVSVHAGRIDAARQLALAGAAVDVLGRSQQSPLHLAASANRPEMIRELLSQGYPVDTTQSFGETALHEAVSYDSVEAAIALLEAGADVHAKNEVNSSPVTEAQSLAMLQLLATHGADLNYIDGCGEWPIKSFARCNELEAIRWLLDHGAEVDRTRTGETALHVAIRHDQIEIASLLLERGANVNQPDVDGETPLFLCRTLEAAHLLFSHGVDPTIAEPWLGLPEDSKYIPGEVRDAIKAYREGLSK